MGREIERKFLVAAAEAARRTAGAKPQAFRQFYLARRDGFSARVRVVDGRNAFLTLKSGSGLSRGEYEYPIPLDHAAELEASRVGAVIAKRRFRLPHARHTIELDLFDGALAPLAIAEVELSTETEAFEPPPWVGREVTGDPDFSNAALAANGLPKDLA